MELRIKGKNLDVQPTIKEYIAEKLNGLDRYMEGRIISGEVELFAERNPSIAANQTIEVTLRTKGHLVRAKDTSIDMHASIDRVHDKLERQIKKYKEKLYGSSAWHKSENGKKARAREEAVNPIVRTKQMMFKPMTTEEAAMQMDLLGHDFFVFKNADTEEINVLYKRKDSNLGLIEPTG